jgi:alpha-tubulin suppressor-like RCC1 family protein
VLAISLGGAIACAIVTGDQEFCWGNNDHGELGDTTYDTRSEPQRVKLPAGW